MDVTWVLILMYLVLLLIIGYVLPLAKDKRKARVFAWLIALGTVVFSCISSVDEIPLTRMLIIVSLQLVSMKIVVVVETYSGENRLTLTQWIAFCLGWFGMRPDLFEKLRGSPLPFANLLVKGISRIAIGFVLLYLSLVLEVMPRLMRFFLPQLLLLAGLSFILHFGILNVTAAFWRLLGINVVELFRSPYKSKSLKEFWGKRWNIAFSEMTALIAYRPLKTLMGAEMAIITSFLLSGLLHEIAISFPVRSGYGLPMIYFSIHALAMHLEGNSRLIQKITQHKFFSHVWVMTLLLLPMPLLFHSQFMPVLVALRNCLLRPLMVLYATLSI